MTTQNVSVMTDFSKAVNFNYHRLDNRSQRYRKPTEGLASRNKKRMYEMMQRCIFDCLNQFEIIQFL